MFPECISVLESRTRSSKAGANYKGLSQNNSPTLLPAPRRARRARTASDEASAPWGPQPFGARRRTGICGVAAPRPCHHIACVAAPCICPPGARAKVDLLFCDRPQGEENDRSSSSAPLSGAETQIESAACCVSLSFRRLGPANQEVACQESPA